MKTNSYEEGLEKRLGFHPHKAIKFNVAGVTFDGRQELLEEINGLCSWGFTPPVELRRASPEDREKFDDPHAIEVWAGIEEDELTKEWRMVHIGYVPRRGCGNCGANFGGKWIKERSCPFCGSQYLLSPNSIIDQSGPSALIVGMDGVNQSQVKKKKTSLGCVIYAKRRT